MEEIVRPKRGVLYYSDYSDLVVKILSIKYANSEYMKAKLHIWARNRLNNVLYEQNRLNNVLYEQERGRKYILRYKDIDHWKEWI